MMIRYLIVDDVEQLLGKCEFSLKTRLPSRRFLVLAHCDSVSWARLDGRARATGDSLVMVPPLSAPAAVLPQELKDLLPADALVDSDDILVALRKVRAALNIPVDDWPIDKES